MTRFLYDTNVFVYAVGGEHAYREPCRQLVTLARDGRLAGEASIELVQEFANLRLRRSHDPERTALEARAVSALCGLHAVERNDLERALDLIGEVDGLGMFDAVHAATALNRGIPAIVTTDTRFDGVPELDRIDPFDAPRRLLSG